MIGVIGAMQIEIDGLKEKVENSQTVTVSGIDFVTGTIHGTDVVLAVCGMGKVFAAVCAQTMILKFQVDALITTGVAGNLSEKLGIKSVAVASSVVQHDMDLTPVGYAQGELGGINLVNIPCDKKLVSIVEHCVKAMGVNYQVGTIATGDQFINKLEQKRFITGHFQAIAAEMEGGSIGQTCYINHVPFVIIRAISDDADGSAPEDFPAFANEAAAISIEIVLDVLKEYGK
ncbi:5'-methylthioadenosine/S-adenosylhomocysteine nucleosidase [uncultured Roseburia sp.]|uniref:adenosylhomocysteine nucleosidase n=1 Tax=Brotonthovivens ammoniilytica TaxID=2981725 RepID=A0ABT2TFA3_9FIRM|nr:5'-methylthioadenosine/adenosylhomocysteine nucleosidase [Brotonthovivens ammoniilytica]MCU6760868.1 5'-methylthioadenosine/adenosylhomocysteine nucleosidase [Brotonthovivens ammoniilytica]SCI11716.1 5'-methylthioadenosine/S-adenosylhomocysteine nucleosidase [uncultured Roseburia sp.]